MTREELIKIIEERQTELQKEFATGKQILDLLAPQRKERPLNKGPIVYGNGHHDGKKPKQGPGSNPKPRILLGATLEARAEIEKMLRAHPEGLTTRQMKEGIKKAGIPITESTIHNALRKLNPIKLNNSSTRSIPNTVYALPKSK